MPSVEPTHEDQPDSLGCDDPDSSLSCPSGSPAPLLMPGVSASGIRVDLSLLVADIVPPITGWLDVQLGKAAFLSGIPRAELSLAVVGDDAMAELHEQYTGITGTTDVLTFDLRDPADPDDGLIEGDIVVCLDEATRQAEQRGHPVRHELLLYAVHGLLHLLGEDDHDQAAYQRMHDREDELLLAMGIGRVFHPDPEH